MRYLFLYIFALWVLALPVTGQEDTEITTDDSNNTEEERYQSGDSKIKDFYGFTIQVSTDGFVIGGMYDKKIARYTHLGLSLDMFWVKGKNEIVDWTGQTLNAETILILPLTLNFKRRLFPESVTNSFRPFIVAGAGGVYGYYISGDLDKDQLPADHKRSQFAPTGFIGLGAEFGRPGRGGYGMDIRYQILRFPNSLGQRSRFDNFQIGFHMTIAG